MVTCITLRGCALIVKRTQFWGCNVSRTANRYLLPAFLTFFAVTHSALAAEPETVTLYYWGTENDTLALDTLQDFESKHDGSDGKPRIKIIMGQSASFDRTGDPQRLVCGIAGGDPPDVVNFDRFAVGEWASRGAFVSLQSYYDRDMAAHPDDPLTVNKDHYYVPCWEEANYKGELFAVPDDTDNRALYYNLDVLEKYADKLIPAGCVDPKDPTKVGPPRTWDQLKKAIQILTQYDANGKLERAGFIPNYGNSWLYIYGWLNGGEFMSPDGLTCTLNSPEVVGAIAYMTELYDMMGGAEAVTAFQTSAAQGGDLDPFMTGKIAMKIDGDDFVQVIANTKRDLRFGTALAPAPEGKKQVGWCGGWAWIIPKGAKHPDEAWEFIKYLGSPRAYQIRCDAMRQQTRASGNVFIPKMNSRKDITEWAMAKYLYNDATIDQKFKTAKEIFVTAMPISRYRPVTPVGQILWNEQVHAMERGYYKKYDSTDIRRNAQIAADTSTRVVQAELDRIFKPVYHPVLHWTPIIIAYAVLMIGGFGFMFWFFGRRDQMKGYFRQEHFAGYFFASPWFIGFIVFGGGPIVFSLFMSFCQYDVLTPPKFVGLQNYQEMFSNYQSFYFPLLNTLFMTIGVPLGMAVGLGIAMLLNFEIKGMAVYRTFFYLPSIMPAVATAILWIWIFNPQQGILNDALGAIGIAGPGWLNDKFWAKPAIILMGLWGAGGGMIVWLAGLKGIPVHLYEAAELDGAGPFRQFWNVTLPMLSPYIFFNLIMGLITTFRIFQEAFIMTHGGPDDATLFYAYELFNNAFRYMRMGYASAMAWVLFAIVLVFTVIQLKLAPRWVHYESEE